MVNQKPGVPGAAAADHLLDLQSSIGNRAVQRMLARQTGQANGPAPQIQRWTGPEHAELGNVTGIQIDLGNGVVLDWGEVLAIGGDEIGSVAELQNWATYDYGKGRIRAALENAEVAGNGVKTLPAPDDQQKKEQKANFYTLLLDNVSHFQSGGAALDAYRSYHARALDLALQAGTNPTSSTTDLNPAYLNEAFGQHFLTDMFSAGHAITPRSEIYNYYVSTWAPKTVDYLFVNLKARLVDGIYQQISTQSVTAEMLEGMARRSISNALDEKINDALANLKGGKAELTSLLGKGIAGVISGAIHDYYNVNEVTVRSVYHPEQWVAKGDSHLNDWDKKYDQQDDEDFGEKTNKTQAENAVKASLVDVQQAFKIGQDEILFKESAPKPDQLPEKVYFKFNSEVIVSQEVKSALNKAAAFLAYNPDTHLHLVGHTDPIGSDEFNDGLGTRRAEAVAGGIKEHIVPESQVSTESRGEEELATTNPHKYPLDRRVVFQWSNQPAPPVDDNQIAYQRAADMVANLIGPPYLNVEGFIPEVIPDLNRKVPDWHWDTMSPALAGMIDDWVRDRFTKDLQEQILNSDMLQKQTVKGYDVYPKTIVEDFLKEIDASPTAFLMVLFSNPDAPPGADLGNGVRLLLPPQ